MHREALQEGDFAHAFWLCVQCGGAMGALCTLRCASHLAANVDALYEEAAERLETALTAACAGFQPDAYCKVCDLPALQTRNMPPQSLSQLLFLLLHAYPSHSWLGALQRLLSQPAGLAYLGTSQCIQATEKR